MESILSTFPLVIILLGDYSVKSFILDGFTTTTQDPILLSGLSGFLNMIQEIGTLRSQVEHQEETNRLLEAKVDTLEKLLEQINETAVEETNYLAQGEKVEGDLESLIRTTNMIESEMTNVVTMATLLSMDMMRVQRSLDAVNDCHTSLTNRLENMTSLLALTDQNTKHLQSETKRLNDTNSELREDLENLSVKTDDVLITTNRVNEMRCESGKQVYSTSSWPMKSNISFSTPFTRSPTISYGVVGVDAQMSGYSLKFDLTISDVTSSGFQLEVQAYYLKRLDVQWMACLV